MIQSLCCLRRSHKRLMDVFPSANCLPRSRLFPQISPSVTSTRVRVGVCEGVRSVAHQVSRKPGWGRRRGSTHGLNKNNERTAVFLCRQQAPKTCSYILYIASYITLTYTRISFFFCNSPVRRLFCFFCFDQSWFAKNPVWKSHSSVRPSVPLKSIFSRLFIRLLRKAQRLPLHQGSNNGLSDCQSISPFFFF